MQKDAPSKCCCNMHICGNGWLIMLMIRSYLRLCSVKLQLLHLCDLPYLSNKILNLMGISWTPLLSFLRWRKYCFWNLCLCRWSTQGTTRARNVRWSAVSRSAADPNGIKCSATPGYDNHTKELSDVKFMYLTWLGSSYMYVLISRLEGESVFCLQILSSQKTSSGLIISTKQMPRLQPLSIQSSTCSVCLSELIALSFGTIEMKAVQRPLKYHSEKFILRVTRKFKVSFETKSLHLLLSNEKV